MNKNTIFFVSLGPGDPQLITLKAFETLKKSDIIFCPSTSQPARIIGDTHIASSAKSRSYDILIALGLEPSKIHLFNIPMSKDRTAAMLAYTNVAKLIINHYRQSANISLVAEGDSGFYSSISYIWDYLCANKIPISRIAGVPAFIAAGACASVPIAAQDEQLLVIPGVISLESLESEIASGKSIVVMKLSQCENIIKQCIRLLTEREARDASARKVQWHYFQDVGTPDEYYTCNTANILQKVFPYFSIMIIRSV